MTGIAIDNGHVAIFEDALQHNLTLQTLQGGMECIDGPLSQGIWTYLVRNKQILHQKSLDAREVTVLPAVVAPIQNTVTENINVEQVKVDSDPSFVFLAVNELLKHREASRWLLLVLMFYVLKPYAGKTDRDILMRALSGSVPDTLLIAAAIGTIYTGIQFFKPKPPVEVLQENVNMTALQDGATELR